MEQIESVASPAVRVFTFLTKLAGGLLLLGILLFSLAYYSLNERTKLSPRRACLQNLATINYETYQYQVDHRSPTYPTLSALTPTYIKQPLSCPSGGTYTMPTDDYPPRVQPARHRLG